MSTPILATKLYIPRPRPNVVHRPRLIERLNESLSAGRTPGVTLISAPAGFGKTTLVSEWVNQKAEGGGTLAPARSAGVQDESGETSHPSFTLHPSKVAWLSLDEGDNDPIRFLAYLIAAVQTIAPSIGAGALAALQSPQPPPTEAILTALLNDIATAPDNFILVLDDYHVIDARPVDASTSVDEALTFLVEHLPPQLHLVIASREDPPLPLARLRVRSQLSELRAADLRFTSAEAAEFLNRVMGLNLEAADIAALENRTEGWIAGLQLAALSMQGRSDIASFIRAFTGSHRFVLDYLMEEVLQRQPERVRSFLLQTAILDRLSGPLCDAVCSIGTVVTEREDGRGMLAALERGNLFVLPLDDQRQWYRYHHLFADVLQARLMEEQPDRVSELHRRASVWFEQNDQPADAIRHALAAKDFKHAADLLELTWLVMGESTQTATWLSWIEALPDELVRARPVLNVWYAYALLGSGDLEAAAAHLKDAERWLVSADTMKVQLETPPVEMVVVNQEQFKSLPATIAVGRAYIAQALGNIPDAVRYASRVLELVPEGDHLRRGQASMLLGITYWASGDLEAANRVFADYTMKLRTAGNIPDAISTTVVLADIRLDLGRLHEALGTVEQCLHFVMDQGEPIPFDTADLYRELSELYLEQGNLEAAAHHLQRGKELGEKAELPVLRYRLCIAQARLKKTQGDLAGALDLLDEAERLFIRTPLPDVCPISALKARIWVAQGRLTEALEWAHARNLSVDDAPGYLREFEHITLARVLIAQHQSDREDVSICDALKLLERLLQAAEEGRRMGSVIEILVLQALAHQAQGNLSLALAPLERALSLAEPEGYVRIFVDEGESMRLLIADFRLLIEKRKPDQKMINYLQQLLTAFTQPMTRPQSAVSNRRSQATAQSAMVEPLSERELEVLQHIADGLTNREIADRLYLSLFTVKAHARSIYDKLDAHSRTQAVARARELGVLPQP